MWARRPAAYQPPTATATQPTRSLERRCPSGQFSTSSSRAPAYRDSCERQRCAAVSVRRQEFSAVICSWPSHARQSQYGTCRVTCCNIPSSTEWSSRRPALMPIVGVRTPADGGRSMFGRRCLAVRAIRHRFNATRTGWPSRSLASAVVLPVRGQPSSARARQHILGPTNRAVAPSPVR